MSPYRRYHSFSGCIRNLVVDSQVSVCVCVCPLSLSLYPPPASGPQVYDLASPGESVGGSPGCRLTDGVCVTGAGPSCGLQASCVADWGSFSCDCHPGYAGLKCDTGSKRLFASAWSRDLIGPRPFVGAASFPSGVDAKG